MKTSTVIRVSWDGLAKWLIVHLTFRPPKTSPQVLEDSKDPKNLSTWSGRNSSRNSLYRSSTYERLKIFSPTKASNHDYLFSRNLGSPLNEIKNAKQTIKHHESVSGIGANDKTCQRRSVNPNDELRRRQIWNRSFIVAGFKCKLKSPADNKFIPLWISLNNTKY